MITTDERRGTGVYHDAVIDGRVGVAPASELVSANACDAQGCAERRWVGKNCDDMDGAPACRRVIALNRGSGRE